MRCPKGDPTYIKNKEQYFMEIAKTVAKASSHPKSPGGCVVVRDREIVGDGRSILTGSAVEIDCLCYAIATASKRGTPLTGAVIYSTRYPFSASVFQSYLMGIKKMVILAHEWEPYYKDEFRRAARLARELSIAIEPMFEDEDQRFGVTKTKEFTDDNNDHIGSDITEDDTFKPDEFDPQDKSEIRDEN